MNETPHPIWSLAVLAMVAVAALAQLFVKEK
jgi:hypothetical protein